MEDHKDGFQNRISCRLTISSKSDTGKISKSILNHVLKGNEALEKKIFFSSPRQENMERKSKLKKKLKFLYFRPHKRLFESAESELDGGERSVFDVINAVNN